MGKRNYWTTTINADGQIVIPTELVKRFGLIPGTTLQLEDGTHEVHILRPVSHLAQVYIEPTNMCNLTCLTCMRNVWNEDYGKMDQATFLNIIDGLQKCQSQPSVFFGGFGEPLSHPDILEMVGMAKKAGVRVELITNGILLSEEMSLGLMRAGLDLLWISLDGASPESYEDVRLGASLPIVLENLARIRPLHYRMKHFDHKFEIGIAFVAMQRNIADLPAVIRLGEQYGARHFSISNVLAHTSELNQDILYKHAMHRSSSHGSSLPTVNLPRMDITPQTETVLSEVMRGNYNVQLSGFEINRAIDTCPFIRKGATAIRWNGDLSPCLPLLHSNQSHLQRTTRISHTYTIGNINDRSLLELWNDPEYVDLRNRIQNFDFSPCTYCNGCDHSKENLEDCLASPFPTCGGCLWSQGLIQCP